LSGPALADAGTNARPRLGGPLSSGLMQDPGAGPLWAVVYPQKVGHGGTQI